MGKNYDIMKAQMPKSAVDREVLFMLERIDSKKRLLDSKRPLPLQTAHSLREHLIINWTYHSNAIEGNTLTLSETKVALEGITIGGKTIREHLEVINHREAILFVEDIVNRLEPLSERQIKNIHRLILKSIQEEDAGVYRKQNVLITGARHIPPAAVQVPLQMELLMKWYEGEGQELHPVARAAALHSDFVKIHPFVDGNGRTARLLLNFELMKNGYPPVVIEKEEHAVYYATLDEAHTSNNRDGFVRFIAGALDKTLDLYLSLV
ncbi:MAG: Filamentation induced by cAMP protein Fic [Paenibacillaceae bacterium]|jgi:Fic family protein|nr:Filamentation induced by cAMP protein Fic [Paenibacillaceae bacterium]